MLVDLETKAVASKLHDLLVSHQVLAEFGVDLLSAIAFFPGHPGESKNKEDIERMDRSNMVEQWRTTKGS